MNDENPNKYDEVKAPEPAEQPSNPLGEATDPAAAAGQAVNDATPTESSAPEADQAAEETDASPDPTPEQEATAHAEGSEQETDQA